MTHVRKVLRTAVRDALDADVAGVSKRDVWAKRSTPGTLPDFAVVAPQSRKIPASGNQSDLTIDLVVVLRAGGPGADDLLDDLAEQIEPIVNTVTTNLAFVLTADLASEVFEIDGKAEDPLAELQMNFEVLLDTDRDNSSQ